MLDPSGMTLNPDPAICWGHALAKLFNLSKFIFKICIVGIISTYFIRQDQIISSIYK